MEALGSLTNALCLSQPTLWPRCSSLALHDHRAVVWHGCWSASPWQSSGTSHLSKHFLLLV